MLFRSSARPRWEISCLASGAISAKVSPWPAGSNTGSYPKPRVPRGASVMVPSTSPRATSSDPSGSATTMAVFRWIDNAACGVFLIDVMVRWRRAGWTSEFWRWGWVDLLAAIPFDAAFRTLQIIRVYRIIRVLRVLYKLQELTTGTTLNERLLALPGVALTITPAALMLYTAIEWFVGVPNARTAGEQFSAFPRYASTDRKSTRLNSSHT